MSLCACTSENTKEESSDLNVSFVLNSAVLTDNYDNKEKKYILNDNFFTDEYGRIVKIIDKKETMLFEYDVDGKLKSYTCTEGDNATFSSERFYENGKLISYNGTSADVESQTTVDIELNEDGSVAKKTEYTHTVYLSDNSEDDSIYTYEYEYNQHGQLSSIIHNSGEYTYTEVLEYDEFGNLTTISVIDENNFEFYSYKFTYILVNDNDLKVEKSDSYSEYELLVEPFNRA